MNWQDRVEEATTFIKILNETAIVDLKLKAQ